MKNIKKNILSFIVLISLFLSWNFVLLNPVYSESLLNKQEELSFLEKVFGPSKDVRDIVINILTVLFTFLGMIMVFLIMYGGFRWMTAGGNDAQVLEAKKYIRNAIIGVIIILASYGITTFIARSAGEAAGVEMTRADSYVL